jgi:hypothetical protein
VVNGQFRQPVIDRIIAGGAKRIGVLSDNRRNEHPIDDLVERAEQFARIERDRAFPRIRAMGPPEGVALIARYAPDTIGDHRPLIAFARSSSEATEAALACIDAGAFAIEIVPFVGTGCTELFRSLVDLFPLTSP